jgi:sugar/nucleoside kinase (ribokinase family)
LREVEALRFAAAAAGVKCTRLGGGSGAPTRAEVDSLIRSQASGRLIPDA